MNVPAPGAANAGGPLEAGAAIPRREERPNERPLERTLDRRYEWNPLAPPPDVAPAAAEGVPGEMPAWMALVPKAELCRDADVFWAGAPRAEDTARPSRTT